MKIRQNARFTRQKIEKIKFVSTLSDVLQRQDDYVQRHMKDTNERVDEVASR